MKKLLILFSVALFSATAVQAQNITVDGIIDNYLENIGGADAWKKVKSMRIMGSVMTEMGAMDVEVASMEPNLSKITITVQGMTLIPQAFDGEVAWGLNPFAGDTEATKMPDEAAGEIKKQAFQNEFIDYKTKGSTVELLGTKEIDGTETYEVKLVNKDEVEKFYYFDTENFVPIMQKQVEEVGPMKGKVSEIYVSSYQEVDGLMIAHTIEQKIDGVTIREITADKFVFNPEDVTKATFAMPKAADGNK